jgi:peptide/nickel transport system substrate-binding protein/oligopeptide transport system substrate-binding protein
LFLVWFFFFAIVSCSSQNRERGYVYYRLSTNPSTLDPALVVDVPGGALSAKLFNGLVKTGYDLSVKPDIAEHWSVSKDGLSYTFVLRKGVTFSNGREVKVCDFKYSFERILDPGNKSPQTWVFEKILGADDYMRGLARDVSGIDAVDDYTLRIRLKERFSPFLSLLTMTAAYVVPREEVERWGPDFSSHPAGSGPFILKEWLPGREIRLEKRRDYFNGSAKVGGIIYRIIPEDLTAVTEFESGNIDVLTIPVSEFSRYRNDPERKNYLSSAAGLNTYYIGFNCSRPPFDNLNLRKAIAYGVDREKILDTIYEKRGRKARGPLPDVLRTWAIQSSYEYNPGKARELLNKEGLNGVTVDFFISAEQEVVDIAEVIQSYVEDIGIKVKIRQLEWSAYKEAINKGEADMFYLSWWADYPDPENFLFPLFHSSNHGAAGNRTRYTNKAVDQLIEMGQQTLEQKKRESFYKRAEEVIVADAPCVFLWHRTDFSVRQPWTKNYKDFPIYSMDKGTDIEIDDRR